MTQISMIVGVMLSLQDTKSSGFQKIRPVCLNMWRTMGQGGMSVKRYISKRGMSVKRYILVTLCRQKSSFFDHLDPYHQAE